MICRICGAELSKKNKYCDKCGCDVMEMSRSSYAQSGVGIINVILSVLALAFLVLTVLILFGVIPSLKDLTAGGDSAKSIGRPKVEGEGFESPEEAVEACYESLNKGDLHGMLSAFAIESYVDNYDTKADIERLGCFHPYIALSMVYDYSDGSDFDRDLRIDVRKGNIVRSLYNMIIQQTVHHDNQTISLDDDEQIDVFLEKMRAGEYLSKWKDTELISFIDPGEICNGYYAEETQRAIEFQTKPFRCEETKDVCALVEIGGERYYQTFMCGKYDGMWYIVNGDGCLSSFLDIPSNMYGLMPAD